MNILFHARYLIECRGYTPEKAIEGEKNFLTFKILSFHLLDDLQLAMFDTSII